MADTIREKLRAEVQRRIDAGESLEDIKSFVQHAKDVSEGAKPVPESEPGSWWAGFAKSLLPGGEGFKKATEGGLAGMATRALAGTTGAAAGTAEATIGAIPIVAVNLAKALGWGANKLIELKNNPEMVGQLIDEAKQKSSDFLKNGVENPLAPMLDQLTKTYMEHPNQGAYEAGNAMGQVYGAGRVLPEAARAIRTPVGKLGTAMVKASEKAPSVEEALNEVARKGGTVGSMTAAPLKAAARPAFKIAGKTLQAIGGVAPEAQPWTIEDMQAREAARAAGTRMKVKDLPTGKQRVTGALTPESVAERKAALDAAETAAAPAAAPTAPEAAPASPITPEMNAAAEARDAASAAEQSRVQGARFTDTGTVMHPPGVVPTELADRMEMADNPEWFKGPVHQMGPPQSAYERMLMETDVPESLSIEGEANARPGEFPPGPSVGEVPKGSTKHQMGTNMPATRSTRGRGEMFPHLSPNDEDILLNNPNISTEDFLAEREMRNRLYRSGDLGGEP